MLKNLVLLVALAAAVQSATWTYAQEALWENVNTLCGDGTSSMGYEQSPINIVRTSVVEVAGNIEISSDYWGKTGLNIKNNGHAHQVDGKWGHITWQNVKYYAAQFHMHQPSEHTIDGMHYDMELHIVHVNAAQNGYLVLGFFFMIGDESSFLKHINYANDIPSGGNVAVNGDVSIMSLINKSNDQTYGVYNYDGSFTTPPCTEGVNWFLFRKVQTLSKAQWDGYAISVENSINFSSGTGTYRKTQPIFSRSVYLRWAKIVNGDNKFTNVQVFGISIGCLFGLFLLAGIAAAIVHSVIKPKTVMTD